MIHESGREVPHHEAEEALVARARTNGAIEPEGAITRLAEARVDRVGVQVCTWIRFFATRDPLGG